MPECVPIMEEWPVCPSAITTGEHALIEGFTQTESELNFILVVYCQQYQW